MYTALLASCVLLLLVSESQPQNLLLATSAGVKTLSVRNSSINTVQQLPATSVDFRYGKNDIYFISGNSVMYSYYSQYVGNYSDSVPSVREVLPLTAVAVDWRSFRIYFTCQASGTVYEAPLLGSTPRPILTGLTGLGDLAIDPYERVLFIVKDSMLMSYDLDSKQEHQYNLIIQGGRVTRVAANCRERTVYALVEEGEEGVLVAAEYNSSMSRSVGRSVKLRGVTGLSVAGGLAVWATDYSLYQCRITPECLPDTITNIWTTTDIIHDVLLNEPLVQSPTIQFACSQLNCSHTCGEDSQSQATVSCRCPLGMELSLEGNVCIKKNLVAFWVQYFLTTLREAIRQGLGPLRAEVVYLLYVCCAMMLTLGLCGLCLTLVAGRPKHSRRRESYCLTEVSITRELSSSLTQL